MNSIDKFIPKAAKAMPLIIWNLFFPVYNVVYHGHQRFFISLGLSKGLNKGGLLRLICSNTNIDSKSIGSLDLFNDFSFFEVDKKLSEFILENLKDKEYDGNTFKVEIAFTTWLKFL